MEFLNLWRVINEYKALNQPAGKYLTVYRNIQRALDKIKDTLKYDDRINTNRSVKWI